MVQLAKTLALLSATAAALTLAHPSGHEHEDAHLVASRRLFAMNAQLSYKACQESPHVRQLQERLAARRLAKVNELRVERERRRLTKDTVLAKDHQGSVSVTNTSAVSKTDLFTSNPTCVLQPTVTHGPYYVKGELIRSDIRESQPGIDLYTEILVMNMQDCTPVENYYIDFWHCNSTGVYSGVVADTNGNSKDTSNAYATFARGLYPTDQDGLVQFVTKFPGHYTSRATHVHILGNYGGNVLENKTYAGGSVSSIGQLFFDQELITAVEATSPYSTNHAQITQNSADRIFEESTAANFDPVVNYVYLGSSVSDGIFSWVMIGVDLAATNQVNAAATYTGNSAGAANTSTGKSAATKGSPSLSTITKLAIAGLALLAPAFF